MSLGPTQGISDNQSSRAHLLPSILTTHPSLMQFKGTLEIPPSQRGGLEGRKKIPSCSHTTPPQSLASWGKTDTPCPLAFVLRCLPDMYHL